jgi:hypothetical protein
VVGIKHKLVTLTPKMRSSSELEPARPGASALKSARVKVVQKDVGEFKVGRCTIVGSALPSALPSGHRIIIVQTPDVIVHPAPP